MSEVIDLCTDARYEAIELFFTEDGEMNMDMSDDELRQVAARFKEAGIEVSSLLGWYKDRGTFLTENAEERAKSRRSLERVIAIAGTMGVDAVLLHPGAMDPNSSYVKVWQIVVSEMREMAEQAAARGVKIGIENVWNRFMLSPKEAVDLVDAVDHPNFGVYLDTANMMAYGYPEQWIRDLGERIVRVHFKDFIRKEHRFVDLMDGDTDWAGVMAALRSVGYDRPVIHEVSGDRAKQLELADRMRKIVGM